MLACFGAGPLENFEQRQSRKCLLTFGDINNNYYCKISRKYLFAFGNINNNCYSNTLNKGIAANVCLLLVILITIVIAIVHLFFTVGEHMPRQFALRPHGFGTLGTLD